MEAQYKKGLSLQEGVKLAVTAINASIQRDTASGNGIDVLTITDKGMEFVIEQKIETNLA
jgi:proteasome beta subunit